MRFSDFFFKLWKFFTARIFSQFEWNSHILWVLNLPYKKWSIPLSNLYPFQRCDDKGFSTLHFNGNFHAEKSAIFLYLFQQPTPVLCTSLVNIANWKRNLKRQNPVFYCFAKVIFGLDYYFDLGFSLSWIIVSGQEHYLKIKYFEKTL